MNPVLEVEQKEQVAWVWLNRPQQLNALNEDLLYALQGAFNKLAGQSSVRCVVLAGRGRAFSGGFDITWMVDRTAEETRANRPRLRAVYDTIEQCPHPVIAAVQGVAMGGGLELALVADFVLASEQARFGTPEVKIGIFPSLALVPRLERLVGMRMAKQMVLTGEPIDAQTAHRTGLITAVTSSLYEDAQQLAEQLAALPQKAVQVTKASFLAHPLPDYLDWETQKATECWAAPERQQAMQAFLDRK